VKLSRKNALPLYHQLRELLREKIESGVWQPGHRLPSENEFVAEYELSRATVRQALQLLENDGLVERMQGRGTFVGRPKLSQDLGMLLTISANGTRTPPVIRVLSLNQISPGAVAALRLALDGDERVWDFRRVFTVDGEPLMLLASNFPVRFFPDLNETDVFHKSLHHTLAEHYGLEQLRQHKEVEVTILDGAEAEVLGANAGAPALVITQVSYLKDGQPFEYRRTLVRGDRCKYYVDVTSPEIGA